MGHGSVVRTALFDRGGPSWPAHLRALAGGPDLARRGMLAAGVANPEAEAVRAQIEHADRRGAHSHDEA